MVAEYLRIIGECPLLTSDQEREAHERGDSELLIRSQLRWVLRLALDLCTQRKFREKSLAISAANLSLVQSVRTFDPSRARLTTYVTRPARWAVLNEICNARRGCGPTLGLKRKYGKTTGQLPDSYDAEDSSNDNSLERVVLNESIESMRKDLESLGPRDAIAVIRWSEGMTGKEVADELGVTRQRTSQLRQAAIRDLQRLSRG